MVFGGLLGVAEQRDVDGEAHLEASIRILCDPPKLERRGRQRPACAGKVDISLPGKGNSNSHGARPVYSFR